MAELDVKKNVRNKPSVKRLELEYKGENYIIINLEAKVIDVDGGDGKEEKTPKDFGVGETGTLPPLSGGITEEGFKKVYIKG